MRERVAVYGGQLAAGQSTRPARVPGQCDAADRRLCPMTVRVVVVGDQALVRASSRLLIDATPDLVVVGDAADGAQAIEVATEQRPGVVLMDVRMPRLDGIEATRRIAAQPSSADPKVIILTTFDLDEYVYYAALRAGASGFLLKNSPPEDLQAAIRIVADGQALLAPSITRRPNLRVLWRARQVAQAPRGHTKRWVEVLAGVFEDVGQPSCTIR